MDRRSNRFLDRRQFLRSAGAAAAAFASAGPLASIARAQQAAAKKAAWMEEPKDDFAPFRMTIQGYSLRKLDFEKAVEALFDLRINYMEIWNGHFPMDLGEFDFKKNLKTMRHNMVRKIAYGVVDLTKDKDDNREVFDFARKLNLYALTANPDPESFESLDKLVEEFGIAVGIHNHGAEDKKYGKPESLEKAIKGHHKLIGACIDTGHYMMAGADPVEAVKRFKDRIYAVHLKDVKTVDGKKKWCLLGQGDLDLVSFLRELKGSGFKGGLAIEYEEEVDDPVPALKKCLDAVRQAVKKL